jgi:hypothetical protein
MIGMEDGQAQVGGLLTPEQQQRIATAIKGEAAAGLIGTGFFALLFGLPLAFKLATGLFVALFVIALLGLLFFAWRSMRLLAEVQAGHIIRARGLVDWDLGRYRARLPGRALNVSAFNLAPGEYVFTYLPRSGRVLTAEPLSTDTPAKARAKLRLALAVANNFNLDDLPALRNGHLRPGTVHLLWRAWSSVLGASYLSLWGENSLLSALQATLDVLDGKVSIARGVLQKTTTQTYVRGEWTNYFYKLGDRRWLVSPEAYHALIEGQPYRVFFLPRSHMLLGIEPA